MTPAQQIAVNTLLLEREALWLRVHALEQEAAKILGEPYPFIRPALPSDRKGKRKAGAGSAADRPPRLRKLADDEVAYRVTYRSGERQFTERHDTAEPLATLLGAQNRALQVERIETVDAAGEVRAMLHESASAPAQGQAARANPRI